MIRKFNFDYDEENDSLFLYDPHSKSKASIELDDFIIDFNNKKQVSGIELLKAATLFKNLSDSTLFNKNDLKEIKECKVEIIERSNFILIKFLLLFKSNRQITTPLLIPMINDSSPAIAET